MKKNLISLAVAGAIMAPLAAQAEITTYGQMHFSFGQLEDKTSATVTEDSFALRSHSSRLGFKGSQDLGNGMSASFKLEYEVDPDNGENGDMPSASDANLTRRNQYIGVKGGFGEVRFGRHDTPLKMSQGKFDQFNDTDGDFKNGTTEDGETRTDNVLAYIGKFDKIGVAVALVPSEGDGDDTTGTNPHGDGIADSTSLSVSFSDGPIYVAVAMDSYDDTDADATFGPTASTSNSLTRIVATYTMGDMQFGLLHQSGVDGLSLSDDETDTLGLSFGMKMGPGKIKAQLVSSEDDAAQSTEVELMAVGYDYTLSKTATAYVMYSNREETSNDNDNTNDPEKTFFGGGLVLKF